MKKKHKFLKTVVAVGLIEFVVLAVYYFPPSWWQDAGYYFFK